MDGVKNDSRTRCIKNILYLCSGRANCLGDCPEEKGMIKSTNNKIEDVIISVWIWSMFCCTSGT